MCSLVENYLNGNSPDLLIDFEGGETALERFYLHTIKRLQQAFLLFSHSECYHQDFLLALRDYLLVWDTDIHLRAPIVPTGNSFGLSVDALSGRCFANFHLPNFVNERFVRQAFQRESVASRPLASKHVLYTDPLIYQLTGYMEFKSLSQKLAVYGALNTPDGYTTLVSLPTGGGKSLITQALSYQRGGLTIVIVPTVSLAIDQVRVAKNTIHTTDADSEIFYYSYGVDSDPIIKAIQNQTAHLLFISPEALINNPKFSDIVKHANANRYLKNIIIDEAHIVVDWGAAFRVDYQCLESWRKRLLSSNPQIRTILLSATYEPHCIDILKSLFSEGGKWIEIRCDALRHEPRYMVIEAKSHLDQYQKMLALVRSLPHPMIIYTSAPYVASQIKDYLINHGIHNVKTFTGLTQSKERRELIDSWVDDKFEIMVATSAFGVGVDKTDVRTVLHMYIPQNPNAYYQELGRGGRDRLPSLSVVCFTGNSLDEAKSRISKKVMTTEKIIGRWDSMYNNPRSLRHGNRISIDTAIKPNYSTKDEFEDSPTSDADVNWNVYVLLLLRRHNLIHIVDVVPQPGGYIFVVEIIDDRLRSTDAILRQKIDQIHDQEWSYYADALNTMSTALRNRNTCCWSEMFYDTYDLVDEYCAGCSEHDQPIEHDFLAFPLKRPVKRPVRHLEANQLAIFPDSRQIITFAEHDQIQTILSHLLRKNLSVLVSTSNAVNSQVIKSAPHNKNILIISPTELSDLLKKGNFYYLSGIIAVVYSDVSSEVQGTLKQILKCISNEANTHVVHILPENVYLETYHKTFTDFVDGPVIPADILCKL